MDVRFVVITKSGMDMQAMGFETVKEAIEYQAKLWLETATHGRVVWVEVPSWKA